MKRHKYPPFAPTEQDLETTLLQQEGEPTLLCLASCWQSPRPGAPALDTTSPQATALSTVLRRHVELGVAPASSDPRPSPATTASFNPLKSLTEA